MDSSHCRPYHGRLVGLPWTVMKGLPCTVMTKLCYMLGRWGGCQASAASKLRYYLLLYTTRSLCAGTKSYYRGACWLTPMQGASVLCVLGANCAKEDVYFSTRGCERDYVVAHHADLCLLVDQVHCF